jgi:hypothetical protein
MGNPALAEPHDIFDIANYVIRRGASIAAKQWSWIAIIF